MRILFVSDDPEDIRIGAVKVPIRLSEVLEANGCTCERLFSHHLGDQPYNDRLRMLAAPWLAWRAVRRIWRDHGPFDVIDAASYSGFLLGLLRRFSPYRRAVLVSRSHGLERLYLAGLADDDRAGLLNKPWYRRILYYLFRVGPETVAMRLADGVIVPNRRELQLIAARGWQPLERVFCIPHGVARKRWLEAPPPDAPRDGGILFSGTWDTTKGIHYLAEAHRLLLARGLRIPMTLLSVMEEYADEQPAEEARIRGFFGAESQPWLTIVPRVADQDANFALYRTHDLLVCSSSTESFGLAVAEALSQRMAVICTRIAGVAEWLRDGRDLVLVPARDAAALAGAIERLWRDPARRRELGENGRRAVYGLSWTHAARATLAAYAAAQRFGRWTRRAAPLPVPAIAEPPGPSRREPLAAAVALAHR